MTPRGRQRLLGSSFLIGVGLLAVSCLMWSDATLLRGMISAACLLLGLLLTGFALQMTVWWGKYGLLDEPRQGVVPPIDSTADR